jgi:alanine-glyoxylate transaminase/serine-glyoxylate transaminase/serine-pyruvate transaminase
MKGYEGGTPAYFATPPVNLIHAYHRSLSQIIKANPSLDERLKLHRETSNRIKAAAKDLGLSQLPINPEIAANGMTAVSHKHFSVAASERADKLLQVVVSGRRQVL